MLRLSKSLGREREQKQIIERKGYLYSELHTYSGNLIPAYLSCTFAQLHERFEVLLSHISIIRQSPDKNGAECQRRSDRPVQPEPFGHLPSLLAVFLIKREKVHPKKTGYKGPRKVH
jgi:hypothetical protein